MPISYAKLKALLDVDEPDYPALAEMAEGAMQHVRKLAASPDVSLASKAVSLAGIMGEEASVGIVDSASKSRHVLVRVAAAHAASLLPDSPPGRARGEQVAGGQGHRCGQVRYAGGEPAIRSRRRDEGQTRRRTHGDNRARNGCARSPA